MRRGNKRRIGIEGLESRNLMAAAVTVTNGNLLITSDAAADLLITQTAADTFTVTDGGTAVGAGTFTGVTGNVTVRTSAADDSIAVDLGGNTVAKRVTIDAGGGANDVSVTNGTITQLLDLRGGSGDDSFSVSGVTANGGINLNTGAGTNDFTLIDAAIRSLTASTGDGDDTLTVGDGVTDVTISRGVTWSDGGGPNDLITVSSGVTLGSLWTAAVNNVDLQSGSTVNGGVQVAGGFNVANSLTVNATVRGSVSYLGSGGADTVTLGADAVVSGNINAATFGGDDPIDLQGDVFGSLHAETGAGDDKVSVAGLIGRNALVGLGDGADFFELIGQIGVAPSTRSQVLIDAGRGNDQVAFRATSQVNGSALINLGAGDDSLAVDDAAVLIGAYVNAGAGNDTYYGTLPRTWLTQKQFETLLIIAPPF